MTAPPRTLQERLRELAADARLDMGNTMKTWDEIRRQVETHKGRELPRRTFENLIEDFAERLDEAADALAEAREALEPFARLVDEYDREQREVSRRGWTDHFMDAPWPSENECRNAHAVLAKLKAASEP